MFWNRRKADEPDKSPEQLPHKACDICGVVYFMFRLTEGWKLVWHIDWFPRYVGPVMGSPFPLQERAKTPSVKTLWVCPKCEHLLDSQRQYVPPSKSEAEAEEKGDT